MHYHNQQPFPKEEITMETNNIKKQYIYIIFYNTDSVIIMNNEFAMDYIVKHSDEIESLEYVDIVIPAK